MDVHSQCAAHCGASGLAVHLDLEVAGRRWEGDAATGPLRCACRPCARASGALLAPRLRSPSGDEPTALGRTRPLAGGVHLRAHCLVHHVRLQLRREHGFLERHVLGLLAGRVEQGCFRRGPQLLASRTSTKPFFGPGTAPLTSRRFSSGRTSWTTSPDWVTRLPPRRPAIFCPLNTREGVAEAPIEPGLRTLCEPWEVGPRWKRCRLIVPAKPFPWAIPVTLIFSPGSNTSTVTFSPTTASVCPRSSSRCRYAPLTLFFFRCPSSGFVTLRSAASSYAIWTASSPSTSAVLTCTTGH